MYLKEGYRSTDQILQIVDQSFKNKIINKFEQGNIIDTIKLHSFEENGFRITDILKLDAKMQKSIQNLSAKTKIKIDDLCGWWLYDENLWIYEKLDSITNDDLVYGTARRLQIPSEWFETMKITINGKKRHTLLVRYDKEITGELLAGKTLYFLKRYVPGKEKNKPIFSKAEKEDFDKIVSIVNKKSKTILFYGVW